MKQYNASPLFVDLSDTSAITTAITTNQITIVYHLHDPLDTSTPTWIAALSAVKQHLSQSVHFLFTTGAKLSCSSVRLCGTALAGAGSCARKAMLVGCWAGGMAIIGAR